MIADVQHRRRLSAVTRLLLSLSILGALWLFRPGPPSLPRSFSAPLTIETIQGLTVWLLWLVGALLALVLLLTPLRAVAGARLSGATASRWQRAPSSSPRREPRSRRPPPSLVILSPQRALDAPANSRRAASAGRLPGERTAASIAIPSRPQISVLGPLTISGAKRSRRGLRARALELIAYLALHPRQVQRDELLEAFWPGADPRRTRPRLRQAVHDARRLLGAAIVGDRDWYSLDRSELDVDLDELERLLAAVRATENEQVEQRLLEEALELFGNEPLAGSDYGWADGELRRLRATHVELLERVGRIRLAIGEPRRALELAERGLAIDGLNEALCRLALEAESALGLRGAVDERYERLCALLDERLGLEPDRETRLLYRSLLGQA